MKQNYDDEKLRPEDVKGFLDENSTEEEIEEQMMEDDLANWIDDDDNDPDYPLFSDEWQDNYSKEVSAAYFAEEEEMKLGIHPSQLIAQKNK